MYLASERLHGSHDFHPVNPVVSMPSMGGGVFPILTPFSPVEVLGIVSGVL